MIGMGIDVGREHDKTVIVIAEQKDENSEIYIRLVKVLSRMPFEAQRQAFKDLILKYKPERVCIDSTGIGMEIAERLKMDLPSIVVPFRFTEETKSDLMGICYDYFTSGKVRVPQKYRQVLEEFSNINKEITPSGRIVFRDNPHGDIAWAAALAFYAVKTAVAGGSIPSRLFHEVFGI